ncbi:MAG: AAA family ATPase, partial [Actinomycetia bacterium]|nr:AAA family ATPase [Actinomycetes bacterium]
INIKKIKKYAEAFELDLNKKISTLSKGMIQMLSLIVAVSTDPGILILDEPASGLDPVMRHAALELLSEECSEDGATVFYSSHILEDVEKIVDSVVMIDQGNILFSGNLDDLKERRKKIIVTFKTNIQEQMLNQIKGIVRVEKNLNSYVLDTFGDTPEIINELKKFGLKSYEVIHLNLDNLFIETVGRVN